MPSPTNPSRRAKLDPRNALRPGLLAVLILSTGLAVAEAPSATSAPSGLGLAATGSTDAAGIDQIRAYCDGVKQASARNQIAIGVASLAAIVLILIYAGTQRKAKVRARAALHDVEMALRVVADGAQDAMVISDGRGELVHWNPAAEALFGLSRQQALGRPLPGLFADAAGLAPDLADLLGPAGQAAPGETIGPKFVEAVHQSGRRFPVRAAFAPLRRDQPGHTLGIIAQVAGPIACAYKPLVADAIIEHAREGIVITDAAGSILCVNASYCRLTGYEPAEIIGKNPSILNSGRHDRAFFEAMWNALRQEGRWEGKIWNRRKDGAIFLEHQIIVALRDEQGHTTHHVGIITDITHEGLDPAQISQLAFYDPLTGLATRALLLDHLREAVHHGKRTGRHLALIHLNLDDFRQVNEQYGYATGDALLVAYAQRLEAAVREDDTVARPGGDAFALVLGEIADPQDVPRIADKLMRELALPIEQQGRTFELRASIGISLSPSHGADCERLLDQAQGAMARAKAAGKNRWVMHQDPHDRGPAN